MTEPSFDVALSFAGQDRAFVHDVAVALSDRGVAVFYDEFHVSDLWGRDLYCYLDEIYRTQCRYAVVFSSAHYARGMWTSHERQSIQARLMTGEDDFLLLVRLDDTELAGFRPQLGHLDGRKLRSDEVAQHIVEKVGRDATARTRPALKIAVPLTAEDRRAILSIRPAGWEYLVLAGTLWQEYERLEVKRLDHELRFAAGHSQSAGGSQMEEFLHTRMDELTAIVSKVESIVANERLTWAMARPGEAGDPVRIQHLGRRFGTALEELLDWAAEVRATVCEPSYRTVLELLARLVDEPLERMAAFVEAMVTEAGQIADAAGAGRGDSVSVIVTLELALSPAALRAFADALGEITHNH